MPVDVFHFNTKHKATDKHCSEHCNPALFKEVMVGDQWLFNSSAAEQTNAWIGGFQSIVHEMRMERYNFFLDEMIRRRNDWMIRELHRNGKNVREVGREYLLPRTYASLTMHKDKRY
jgi:hypothetical protein